MLNTKRGFTITELILIIVLITILIGVAIPYLRKYYSAHKFWGKANDVEYSVKWAKLYAMKTTTNVGLCPSNNNLEIYDMGTNRGAGICTGKKIKTINGEKFTITGTGAAIDPRGIAIWNGNVCITDNNTYFMQCISDVGIINVKGTGQCPTNCPQ